MDFSYTFNFSDDGYSCNVNMKPEYLNLYDQLDCHKLIRKEAFVMMLVVELLIQLMILGAGNGINQHYQKKVKLFL